MDHYLIDAAYDKKESSPPVDSNENKKLCMPNMEPNQSKLKKSKLNDEEKNDIISVEDEIYNLSFKASKL